MNENETLRQIGMRMKAEGYVTKRAMLAHGMTQEEYQTLSEWHFEDFLKART